MNNINIVSSDDYQTLKEDFEDLKLYLEELEKTLPVGFCVIGARGNINNANKTFQELTGYQSLEIIGEFIEKFFLEKEELLNLIKEAQKQKSIKGREFTLITKNEKEIPVTVSISPRRDAEGELIGYFLVITEIQEAKEYQKKLEEMAEERAIALIREKALVRDAEQKAKWLERRTKELEDSRLALMNILEDIEEERKKLEEEKNKTQAIITNFADGLLFFDQEKKLSLMNPQAENFLKVEAENLIGKPISEISKIPEFQTLINIISKEIKKVFREELKVKEDFVLEISTVSISSENEEIGTLVILHDVSREKLVEKMKSEFVSISAHQLRTPLSAIKWSISLLKDIVKEEEAQDLIEKLEESNDRMIKLVDDLLNVSRIEEGRYIYKPELKDFVQIAEDTINPRIETAKRKGINFSFKKPEESIPKVKVDEEKISLCVQNLVENAINYTSKGGKVEAEIKYDKAKKEIVFSVKDTGIGIPKDQQDRIFTRFFRAENAIRQETEGNGLGLFITRNIVEAHKGKVWFESEEGKGSKFYFSLPVK